MAENGQQRSDQLRGRLLVALAFALAASAMAMALHHAGGVLGDSLWRLELATYDWRARLAHPSPTSGNLVIVTIGDESIREMHGWPWPRSAHANLIDRLSEAGASLICFDVIFSGVSTWGVSEEDTATAEAGGDFYAEETPSPADLKLRDAIQRAGNVVLACRLAEECRETDEMEATMVSADFPYWEFEDAALGIAAINIPTDADNTVRRAWLWLEHQDVKYPTFPTFIAATQRGRDPVQFAQPAATEARTTHPYIGLNGFLIDYRDAPGRAFERVPYYQVLDELVPPARFKDKVVLVGATAESLQDFWQTPMTSWRTGSGTEAEVRPMPGVEVQANAIETLLGGTYVRPVALPYSYLMAFLLAFFCAVATVRLRPLFGAVASLFAFLVLVLLAFTLYFATRSWIPVIGPVLGAAVAYSASTVYMYLVEERQRLHMKRAWRQRVSSEVLSVILSNPGLTQVLGKRIEATCLFSDLRGFTDMCHALEPERVVQRLNEYLTEMTRIIQKHGGVIHKFVGDGIMAVFGDPLAYSDHAARALRAAVDMQRAMAQLRDSAQAEGRQPLHMRIGVHTGPLVAGDIGSEQFLEYTVIGATVSTASRLEGLNKEFGTEIMISEATRDAVAGVGAASAPNQFAITPLGPAEIRGVPEPMQVFSVASTDNNRQASDSPPQ